MSRTRNGRGQAVLGQGRYIDGEMRRIIDYAQQYRVFQSGQPSRRRRRQGHGDALFLKQKPMSPDRINPRAVMRQTRGQPFRILAAFRRTVKIAIRIAHTIGHIGFFPAS